MLIDQEKIIRDMDPEELKSGSILYLRPKDVDLHVCAGSCFPVVHNKLFDFLGIQVQMVLFGHQLFNFISLNTSWIMY